MSVFSLLKSSSDSGGGEGSKDIKEGLYFSDILVAIEGLVDKRDPTTIYRFLFQRSERVFIAESSIDTTRVVVKKLKNVGKQVKRNR